ncbi:MAG: DUF3576 domain-containing protein [Alphaproteobacteria bacterium]|nr:DUF3576 domain-containing protein [Alphaproteobacteria bacterium]
MKRTKKHNKRFSGFRLGLAAALSGFLVSACGLYEEHVQAPDENRKSDRLEDIDYSKRSTIFGKGGMNLFGSDTDKPTGGTALGVNSYLWRASLDTISFMPISTADIFGGIIITDWHTPNEAPNERFKLNVYVLDKTLRADGIRVAVFRQVQNRQGLWKDAAVPGETGTKIEDAILIRARQLRNQSLSK